MRCCLILILLLPAAAVILIFFIIFLIIALYHHFACDKIIGKIAASVSVRKLITHKYRREIYRTYFFPWCEFTQGNDIVRVRTKFDFRKWIYNITFAKKDKVTIYQNRRKPDKYGIKGEFLIFFIPIILYVLLMTIIFIILYILMSVHFA